MAESEGSSGNWLMTYGDFITLMMIFFIVLYTLTPGVKRERFDAFISAFKGQNGILKHPSMVDKVTISLQRKRAKNWRKLVKMIKADSLKKQVQLKMLPSGIRITLGEAVTFKTYSAVLISDAKKILIVIANALQSYKYEKLKSVKIDGYTDNRPVKKHTGKYPNNWELGAARAVSVLQYLTQKSNINPKKFEASTFGKYHPRASNKTTQGRRKNRRVVIYVKYFPKNKSLPKASASQIDSINFSSQHHE